MSRYPDVHPNDIDPETNRPYPGYSSPSLDTSFHDGEMDVDDDEPERACRICACTEERACMESKTDADWRGPCGWAAGDLCDNPDCIAEAAKTEGDEIDPMTGKPYPDDDACSNPRGHSWVIQEEDEIAGEGRSYCEHCGADGDA